MYGILESETNENWLWFLERLHDVIGNPPAVAICLDAGKGLEAAKQAFRTIEHGECMRHLVANFKKFHGRIFYENLWPASLHGAKTSLKRT